MQWWLPPCCLAPRHCLSTSWGCCEADGRWPVQVGPSRSSKQALLGLRRSGSLHLFHSTSLAKASRIAGVPKVTLEHTRCLQPCQGQVLPSQCCAAQSLAAIPQRHWQAADPTHSNSPPACGALLALCSPERKPHTRFGGEQRPGCVACQPRDARPDNAGGSLAALRFSALVTGCVSGELATEALQAAFTSMVYKPSMGPAQARQLLKTMMENLNRIAAPRCALLCALLSRGAVQRRHAGGGMRVLEEPHRASVPGSAPLCSPLPRGPAAARERTARQSQGGARQQLISP